MTAASVLQEFAAAFDRCAVCHWPESDPRRRLEIHHLMSGQRASMTGGTSFGCARSATGSTTAGKFLATFLT